MSVSYFMRPDENWATNGAVADTVGTTDTDYQNEWLVDGRTGRPVRGQASTMTWTITKTAGYVDGIIVANHNIDAATITIGGTISTTITVPTARLNSIPFNPFTIVTPSASCSSMSVGVSGNSVDVVIGEVLAGRLRTFPRGDLLNIDLADAADDRRKQSPTFGHIPPYDDRQASRSFIGTVLCTTAQLDDMMAWHESQKNGTLPSGLIINSAVNDARVVHLEPPQARRQSQYWLTVLRFIEYPRSRW
jgi:hypothetical protein